MSFTYNSLTSAITQYTENDSTEFRTMLPWIVENAVRNVAREVDVIGLDTITTVSASASPYVALPNECLLLRTLAHVSGTTKTFLKKRPYDFAVNYWPDYTSTGTPLFYDRVDDAQLYIAPTPAPNTPFELRYVTVSIPSSANQNSYILTRYPELTLYKCMVESCLVMQNNEDAQIWQGVYDRAREGAENEARRNRRDDTNTQGIMGSMGKNTLKGNV